LSGEMKNERLVRSEDLLKKSEVVRTELKEKYNSSPTTS